MTTTVQSLITQAGILLKDTSGDRWSEDELLFYLNEGQRQIVIDDSASNIVNTPVLLQAGVTQQTPDDCNELVDISLNLGREWVADTEYIYGQAVFSSEVRYICTDGHTSSSSFDPSKFEAADFSTGMKIAPVTEANMDQLYGDDWALPTMVEAANAKNFEPNVLAWVLKQGPDAYQNFFVYPAQPQIGRMYVEMTYSQLPSTVTIDDNITLRDKYAANILDYVLFRAYSKDLDNEANQSVAINYFNKFNGEAMKPLKRRN